MNHVNPITKRDEVNQQALAGEFAAAGVDRLLDLDNDVPSHGMDPFDVCRRLATPSMKPVVERNIKDNMYASFFMLLTSPCSMY